MIHHQEIIQITKEVREDCIVYYLPCRNPKKVIVIQDHVDLRSITVEEIPCSRIPAPKATFMQMNTKMTLEKLLCQEK